MLLVLKSLNKDCPPSRAVIYFHTDPNWVPSTANDSDSYIHFPPIWDKDRRKWYIPPPGYLRDPSDLPCQKQYVLPPNWRPDPHDPPTVAATGSGLFATGSGLFYTSSAPLTTVSKFGPPRQTPRKVDLRTEDDIIFNQGNLGSCVANALASAFIFTRRKQHDATAGPLEPFIPSRLFAYYNMRAVRDKVGEDIGGNIINGLKGKTDGSGGGMVELGVCSEEKWEYGLWDPKSTAKGIVYVKVNGRVIRKFVVEPPPGSRAAIKPPPDAYADALQHKVIDWKGIASGKNRAKEERLNLLRACLDEGFPFVFSFTAFRKFINTEGREFEPGTWEQDSGHHTVMAVGYDNATQRFTVQNSWGEDWYDRGCCYMPFNFLHNYGYNFCFIQEVSPNW